MSHMCSMNRGNAVGAGSVSETQLPGYTVRGRILLVRGGRLILALYTSIRGWWKSSFYKQYEYV